MNWYNQDACGATGACDGLGGSWYGGMGALPGSGSGWEAIFRAMPQDIQRAVAGGGAAPSASPPGGASNLQTALLRRPFTVEDRAAAVRDALSYAAQMPSDEGLETLIGISRNSLARATEAQLAQHGAERTRVMLSTWESELARRQTQTVAAAGPSGLAAIPWWVWLAGIGVAAYLATRPRGPTEDDE